MKRFFIILFCILMLLCGCTQRKNQSTGIIEINDSITLTGAVDYSDSPSDIGQEYCLITMDKEIEYYYIDIYGEKSKWSSNVFFTKGDDTALLKEYVGQKVTLSGTFDAESHGIPYITNIKILQIQ